MKGYEFEKGRYVVLSAEGIDQVRPQSTRVIDLVQFTDESALDPMYVDRTYYLAPDGKTANDAFADWAGNPDANNPPGSLDRPAGFPDGSRRCVGVRPDKDEQGLGRAAEPCATRQISGRKGDRRRDFDGTGS